MTWEWLFNCCYNIKINNWCISN